MLQNVGNFSMSSKRRKLYYILNTIIYKRELRQFNQNMGIYQSGYPQKWGLTKGRQMGEKIWRDLKI